MTEENKTVDETTATEQPADLNINDLNTLRAIIDLASSRGSFKTAEMVAVGTAYNKLNAFLEQVAKQAEEQSQSETGPAAEAE